MSVIGVTEFMFIISSNFVEEPKPRGETDASLCSWTKERSKLLLNEYKERYSQFNSPTQKKKALWTEICQVINAETQSTFNSQQVEGRFKTMLSSYRKYKDAIKRTGSERKEYEFASEMNEIFGNCHSKNPTFVVESSSTSTSNPKTLGPVFQNGVQPCVSLNMTKSATKPEVAFFKMA